MKQMFFLEFFFFFCDPIDVDNLTSGSSVFSKSNLNIWTFLVHILSKSSLENLGHYFASMWNECNCGVVWTFFGTAFLWNWKEFFFPSCDHFLPVTKFFPSCDHCRVFQICWHTECSTLIVSSFRIWNSSAGIPLPPLALFLVMLPKAHLTSHSKMPGSRWVITPSWLSGSLRSIWSIMLFFPFSSILIPGMKVRWLELWRPHRTLRNKAVL